MYAVWEYDPAIYRVNYNANGGSGAPSSQTKTYGVSLTLSSVIPTRIGYDFLGWSTSSTATSATYDPGDSYTTNASVTFYAVWQKTNYDFSISNLTVSNSEPYKYDQITVKVRTDSWDQVNAYSDISVQLYYSGRLVSTQYVDFSVYEVANITFTLNVGKMCVGEYSYLRVVVCCSDYILHLGENIVYTFLGCCTYYYNMPSFEEKDGVHFEIERIDEHDVWYTMPSEPGQEAVSMDRYEFEKYLDKGNISLLFSRYPILNDDRTPEEIAADRAEEAEPHIEREPSREPTELEVAKKLIEDFCAEEYNSESVDFSDLTNIGIGYTTITDDEIPIQVVVNLVDFKIEKYLADDIVEVSKYDSLHDLIEYELNNLVFDALISVSDDLIEQYNEKYGTGIPQLVEKEKPRKTLPVYNTHPEIPDSEKHNYRITDNEIGMGGAKEKFRKNIAAINLLHELEFDNRLATPEEQEILAQYSGWGGLADAFDETKDNWHSEFTELYTTLSPEEYEAAKESTLTAFYTPPVVIKAMYSALENMGLKTMLEWDDIDGMRAMMRHSTERRALFAKK